MCGTQTVPVALFVTLLVAASFCSYQAHIEKKVGRYSEIKSEGSCKNE